METRVTEIAEGIHQLTTFVDEMNFGFNQYLVHAEEPLLFHTGMRHMFPLIAEAAAEVVPVERLRWISFGHVEADECGSMNEWLAAAPESTVVQGMTGCMVSLMDLADRPPRPLADGDVLDIGGHRMRWIDTPHVPHAWEAGLLYDEDTRTLFCGDLFSQWGPYPALTSDDIAGPAIADPDSSWMSLAPSSAAVLRRLADLEIGTLAQMHGPAFNGDCSAALLTLADDVDAKLSQTG
jgi:flavorubredoxin